MKITSLVIILALVLSILPLAQASPQGKTSIKVFVAEKPQNTIIVEALAYSNSTQIIQEQKQEISLIEKFLDKIKKLIF